MRHSSEHAAKLTKLLKSLDGVPAPELPGIEDPVAVLVQSFLLWETTTSKAMTSYGKLLENIVDFNDLRISLVFETMEFIGTRYPRAEERCRRLRAVLNDIYLREHEVSLERIRSLGKREVMTYLESLEGMTPYVSARLLLLSFDFHAIPVDEQLRARLLEADAVDESADPAEISSWMARQIKAQEGVDMHYRLQNWAEQPRTKKKSATKRKISGKSSHKKTGKSVARSGK